VFDPGDIEPSYEKIQSTFPCLATLTMMEDCHMKQLFLHLGLAKTRNDCVYADRQAWDNFIAREELNNVETTFFEIDRRRHVYLRIGVWTAKHKCRTPVAIWRDSKINIFPVPKLYISSLALRFVTQVGTIFTFEDLPASDAEKSESDRDGSLTTSSDDNQSSSEENDLSEDKKFERR
jgi:hypothetical protein